ncbi:transposon Tf2-6 polyprotein [Trichonephila inaurata madagascariensis]|uniref:Transposon Tf2-6 polyprotein n=1 Tax=Trichonephila inaurata madagascariensis TaxID=2747483 RepID=A0A8X7CL18_9ARAC|nr:transposon Tf2-6 polyprotein [Trichonephila inaurata madagascariensis]
MFTCLTSPVALLDIEVCEATGTVCADTGASQSVDGELMFKFLKNRGLKFSKFHLAMCLADGQQSASLVQKATVPITIGGRTFQIDLIFLPHAKGNRTLLGVDFLQISGIVMDMRNNFWYFGDKPSFKIPFSKDASLSVDDSPVEINSTSCPTNLIPTRGEPTPFVKHFINTGDHPPVSTAPCRLSPNRKKLFRKEIDNLLADIYQKQVEKGSVINIEAGKNKYFLKISNALTRGNTVENTVSDEANDVDATPETDSSTKAEGNASVMPKDRASGSKDMRIGSGNEARNKDVRYDGRTKNDRYSYNKQSREGDYLSQNKADSKDYSAEARLDTSPATDLSLRPRSHIPSNKANEGTNYYDSNRKYDGEKKGNFYHCSNSDTRRRRYGLILMKSTIIKIKIIKMLEDKIITVK